jgi:hypothetical protein
MSCVTKENLGKSICTNLPQLPRGMFTVPEDFEATPTEAIDPAFWQAAMKDAKAVRIYLWPFFVQFDDASEAAVYEETPLSDLTVRDGKYRFRPYVKQDLCLHRAMYTHRANGGRVIWVDVAGNLFGTEKENGNFTGYLISNLNTEKLVISNGTVSSKSPIYVVQADNRELDAHGVMYDASAFINTLQRLTDVKLTLVGAIAADSFQVQVSQVCDGQGVSGLAKEDFLYKKTSDGTRQNLLAATEDPDTEGLYTLTNAAFVDGTINLVSAATLTIDAYESVGAVAVNVP